MDISEKGLETLIVKYLTDNNGYEQLTTSAYNKEMALVEEWLVMFINKTQHKKVTDSMCFASPSEKQKFLTRLRDEITKRGVTDVLRKGYKFNGQTFDLYYPLPSKLNKSAKVAYEKNVFGVIRQLRYSKKNENAIDFVVFINGLPLATFELKNSYTGQKVGNAIAQYKNDRKPEGEPLLQKGRCAVHMAVDDELVYMCTELKGKDSIFLPFNRGNNGGAGNPVVEGKTKTAYLWEDILSKPTLSDIIENFAQIVGTKVIWPRYHQLDAVRSLLSATLENEIGTKFLIQHSAGSGKSNSISWLAYQLVLLMKEQKPVFDSVIVVTDRVNLDKQLRDNINSFKRLQNIVGWADKSYSLREMLKGGKKIIITTIFKFSYILEEIGTSQKNKHFAIIIDEAHSSQSGKAASAVSAVLSGNAGEKKMYVQMAAQEDEYQTMAAESVEPVTATVEEDDVEDKIVNIIKGRKMAKNANYYAFTATPKNKTLEMFGTKVVDAEGGVQHLPFHEYTMKQAIEEEFILDVLRYYTPYTSYYKVQKAIEDDPEFDKKKSQAKIRAYVERQPETIEQKARIMVDHFCKKVYMKIGGKARAMVVTSSIERAIEFYHVISRLLEERGNKYKAIVAFTDKEIDGKKVTEASLNGFPSSDIEAKVAEEPYRILIVADKFQTGYDQPLLHTMYVDKQLSDVKAVQTLSRLNRCYPGKKDTFVLDFANDPDMIRESFQKYYKTTILEGESDVNKLNDLIETIEAYNFYTDEDVEKSIGFYLSGKDEDRSKLDAVLDAVTERFKNELTVEDDRVKCKSAIKNYTRIYPFLGAIMPFESEEWEKKFIFYSKLLPKLPKLKIDDFTEGLLETIDFDKYRIVKEQERAIELEDTDTSVNPIPVGQGGGKKETEMDLLSNIVQTFNDTFGNIEWKNKDEVQRQIEELPARMASNQDLTNAMNNGNYHAAQIAFTDGMMMVVASMLEEKTEFVQHYFNNKDFQNLVNERVFSTIKARHEGGMNKGVS